MWKKLAKKEIVEFINYTRKSFDKKERNEKEVNLC